jgi:hypothetical protein
MERPGLVQELFERLAMLSIFLVPFGVGMFSIGYGVREGLNLEWLVNHGETAEGRVISVETTDDGSGPYYKPTVRFTDLHGQRRDVIARYDLDEVTVGASARVYYDPSDRERVVIEEDTGMGRLVACVVFGIALALFAAVFTGPVLGILTIPLRPKGASKESALDR